MDFLILKSALYGKTYDIIPKTTELIIDLLLEKIRYYGKNTLVLLLTIVNYNLLQ